MGRRRAWVLVGIHAVIFIHLLHWQLAGETLSPVEPSEAIFTVAEGAVNAGAMLLGLSILATLVLGRFFCGWACHVVALQDLCAWIMKRVGIRPRPLRSRWLVFVPLVSGLYMFFFPALVRALEGSPGPDYHLAMTKADFWETFPGPWIAVLTFLVAGFAIVYVVGAKGFCTYACPYGGLFGVADALAPWRIRVTDACKGCGHCTAVCTSNVLVHQEVRDYRMVVDPGCMKCLDCVSACPENALYFGFGRPALLKRSRRKKPARRSFTFTALEDLALLLCFLVTLLVLRGVPAGIERVIGWFPEAIGTDLDRLYNRVPLLLALGLAATIAFLMLLGWRALRRPGSRFLGVALREDTGITRRGRWIVITAALCAAFVVHSAWVQWHAFQGTRSWRETLHLGAAAWTQDPAALARLTESERASVARAAEQLARADALGLFPDDRLLMRRAYLALLQGQPEEAHERLQDVVSLRGKDEHAWRDLATVQNLLGRPAEALKTLERGHEENPEARALTLSLFQARAGSGKVEAAITLARTALGEQADHHLLRESLVRLYLGLGRLDEAVQEANRLAASLPELPGPALLAILARVERGEKAEKDSPLAQALDAVAPRVARDPRLLFELARLNLRAGRGAEARRLHAAARALDPRVPRLSQ